jgi:hypothetical protein
MSIYLYSMGNACGFCIKAEKLFEEELNSGEMVLKTSKDKGAELFNGFPSFLNKKNGSTHSGLPSSKEQLYTKLGVKNSFASKGIKDTPTECDKELMFIKGNVAGIENTSNGVWWCHKGKNGAVGSVVLMISSDSMPQLKKFDLVLESDGNTKLTKYPVVDGNDIEPFITKYSDRLQKYFPCTTKSTWSDIDATMGLLFDNKNQMKTVEQVLDELIPSPCKNDKNLYCCEGNDGPSFFDIKTIIMLCVICLLFFGVVYLLKSK